MKFDCSECESPIVDMPEVRPLLEFTFSWKTRSDAPRSLFRPGAAVSLGDISYFSPYDSNEVFTYNGVKDEWQDLPPLPQHQRNFQLTVINGQLTVVGGELEGVQVKSDRVLTGRLLTYTGNEWNEQLLPTMPTKRVFPSVVKVGNYLIVAGGQTKTRPLSTVEVLDLKNMTWHKASDLPERANEMSVTVCGGRLYLAGGLGLKGLTRSVYSCSVETLLRSCGLQQGQGSELLEYDIWTKEPNELPWKESTLVTLGDQLLAVGGVDSRDHPTDEILCYHKDKWYPVGKLLTARRHAFLATVVGNRLTVVGGLTAGTSDGCTAAEVANIELSSKYEIGTTRLELQHRK